jgi:REP element-mobilizing transposase RayT
MSDHVYIPVFFPSKYSVSQIVGFIKGESAISIARTVWTKKDLHRPEFLGKGLLCLNNGQGRGDCAELHQASRN